MDEEDELPLASEIEPRGRGRPPTYRPEFAAIARGMCAMGATDYELARELGVTVSTIQLWSVTKPEFCESVKVKKGEFDERVERTLAQRAVGYTYEAEKVHFNKDGSVSRATVIEHIPPDPSAAKNWLAARRAKEWSQLNKVEVEVTNNLDDMELARRIAAIVADSEDKAKE